DRTGEVLVGGLLEHVEEAAIHSGDASATLPPHSLSPDLVERMKDQATALARELGVVGLMNVQFAIQGKTIYVLEVNPRASRTVPFISKATGVELAKIAALCMVGKTLRELNAPRGRDEARGGEGVGLPLRPLPRGRRDPRPGDEVHRRGDGDRRGLLLGLRQERAGGGVGAPELGDGVRLGEG